MKFEMKGDWEMLTIRLGEEDERLGSHHADVVISCVKQRVKSTGIKVQEYNMYLNPVMWFGGEWDSISLRLGRNKFWSVLHSIVSDCRTFRYDDGRLGLPQLRWTVSEYGWITMSFSTKSDNSDVKEEEE